MGFSLTPAGVPGYWGPVTSSLDWCEENYIVNYYICEFWNSLSNAIYLILSFIGMYNCWKIVAETRTHMSFIILIIVGFGSFAFHASLLFETQMMDELPMIYCACVLVYNIIHTFPPERNKIITAVGLTAYAGVISIVYLYYPNPLIHQFSYGLLVSIMVFTPFFHIRYISTVQKKGIATSIAYLYAFSLITYLGGFVIWNFENFNCDLVRKIKNDLGYPWRVVFELHSWWHYGTGFGTYGSILMQTYLRMLAKGRKDVRIVWAPFPFLVSSLSRQQILEEAERKKKK
ncbi:Alkaline ceramidase 3 [Phlyctochytrium planicorne]|nr:Alkaline ceramidase 3 [Phlyctochytrium planicorne]